VPAAWWSNWAALHRGELMDAWLALCDGRMPEKIAPLE
jgi:hypothetical protein